MGGCSRAVVYLMDGWGARGKVNGAKSEVTESQLKLRMAAGGDWSKIVGIIRSSHQARPPRLALALALALTRSFKS